MWTKKFIGISTLLLAALLFIITFLSSAYEIISFSEYVKSLNENKDEVFAIFTLILYMIFSTPIALIFSIIFLVAGIKFLRGTAGKKTQTATLVVKALSFIGLTVLFIVYLRLYPTGWVSKIFYIVTAALSALSFTLDFCLEKREETKTIAKENVKKK